ncbi:Asp23/Gls24 family envelope stress response protein [Egicoccus sp. AB-alg2]|uniref:Asp23/Gls24 family envelope stress response protein n=1 Tax=Egicoccus sp. AB-alg2 TaxID=3242693 RepID=UPI00359EB201
MSSTPAAAEPSSTERRGGPSTEVARHEGDRGTTTIDDNVVAKIVAIAAREVNGVASLGGAVSGAIADVVGRIRGDEHRTAGVGVEVGTRQAAADLTLTVQYPATIQEVASSVRQNVIDRVEELTGLEVVEVNIAVTDLRFGDEDDEGAEEERRVE